MDYFLKLFVFNRVLGTDAKTANCSTNKTREDECHDPREDDFHEKTPIHTGNHSAAVEFESRHGVISTLVDSLLGLVRESFTMPAHDLELLDPARLKLVIVDFEK